MASQSRAMRLKFWGVRGSIATPGPTTLQYGGNTSCLEVRAEGQILVLDAGTGLRLLGRSLLEEFGDRPMDLTLLLTHTHWDHIQGLPFFLPVYHPNNRLHILGYEGARVGLETVLNSQMENPFFPIGLKEVPANIQIEELKVDSFDIGKVHVQTCPACHPGRCVGYRLSVGGNSLAFFPDNELRHDYSRPETPPSRDGESVVAEFVQGVDVLVMDSQYDAAEYEQHTAWGHGCVDKVVGLALQAKVKRLYLFHHDPDHDDGKINDMANHARKLAASKGSSLHVEAAREGLEVEFPV
ncbi:MAG TPA: MBL fold metallo-hydrolase [Verrucomicrobiae bacterium]|nr:MBL fold metallo-hydrolase [Verrucomicrobiae bacterium]